MPHQSGAVLEMLRQAQCTLDTHPHISAAVSHSNARQALDSAIADARDAMVERLTAAAEYKGQKAARSHLRRRLVHQHMRPIAIVAATERGDIPSSPGFRLPSGRTDAHDITLYAAAQIMADAAEPFAPAFIGAGLPLDFIAQLRQAGAALAESVVRCQELRAERATAGRAIPAALAEGCTAVRVLDALLAPRFDAAGSLPTWNRATTVRRPARSRTATSHTLSNTHE